MCACVRVPGECGSEQGPLESVSTVWRSFEGIKVNSNGPDHSWPVCPSASFGQSVRHSVSLSAAVSLSLTPSDHLYISISLFGNLPSPMVIYRYLCLAFPFCCGLFHLLLSDNQVSSLSACLSASISVCLYTFLSLCLHAFLYVIKRRIGRSAEESIFICLLERLLFILLDWRVIYMY